MSLKKFLIVGLVSLSALVGCGSTQESASGSVEKATSGNVQEVQETAPEVSTSPDVEETATPSPEVDPAEVSKETAKEQIQTLSSLIGKSAQEVDAALGEPANVQNLEDTDILLVRYYKVEYLNEIAKIEVVFNDDAQVVNYISFVILKADDIESSKETLANALTELYGESSIERYVDVQGRQNRNWQDETLMYDLRYFENNISLDIYPLEK